ncbi:MAG: hypothetical protein ABL860_01030, partial [Candidatus Nitrotoga sp.]
MGNGKSPVVYFLETEIGTGGGIPFSPDTNDAGDIAFVASLVGDVKGALALSDVHLNGEVIAQGRPVLDLAMNSQSLVWIESTANGAMLVRHDLLTVSRLFQVIDTWADRIVAAGEVFVLSGIDVASGNSTVVLMKADGSIEKADYGSHSVFLSGNSQDAALVSISGDPAGQLLYAALDRFLRIDSEDFSSSNNEAGRLAWFQSYRLAAAAHLGSATEDVSLQLRAVNSAMAILDQADVNGNFPSIRYSLGDDPVVFSLHSAWIYHAAFETYDWLTVNQKQRLVDYASRSFASFEADWLDYGYRFTPGTDLLLDGVIQPFNMQSAMGLLALDLYNVTGNVRYLNRTEQIYDRILAELVEVQGVNVWHYWPQMFTNGWAMATFESANAPTWPAVPPDTYEDVYHAIISIPFLLSAAKSLGRR